MGIFDIFTNDAAKEAANKNAALYTSLGANNSNLFNTYGANANAALTAGMTGATGALDTGFAGTTDALRSGAGGATGALDTGLVNSTGALRGGIADATAAARAGIDAYAPLTALGQKYGQGSSLYLDALGVNGAGGTTRAQNAFTTGPGYQFQVDQATDAAARNGAKLGMATSGNTLDAIRSKAQGIASGEYNSYLDRLGGFVNPELQATSGAASGIAAGYRNLADIGMTGGMNLANLFDTNAGRRSALSTGLGTGLASASQADAAARAGLFSTDATNRVGVGGNVASGLASANKDVTSGSASANNAQAQAAQNGSNTFWNGLFSVAGNAAKAAFPFPKVA